GQGLPDNLRALVGQQPLVDLGPVRGDALQVLLVVSEHDLLVCCQAAQALMSRRRSQPGSDPVRMLDAIDVFQQPQPRGLRHIRGVALNQLELSRDGPDEPRKLIDEPLPSLQVARRRTLYQLCDVGFPGSPLRYRRHCASAINKLPTPGEALRLSSRGSAGRGRTTSSRRNASRA